jgi:hypothetical protein
MIDQIGSFIRSSTVRIWIMVISFALLMAFMLGALVK